MFDVHSLVKYLLEGLAVAVAAYLIPKKSVQPKEIALIGLTAAAMFAVLDQFAPLVAVGARQGAGFGIGLQQVGYGYEGFNDYPDEGYDDYDSQEGFQTINTSDTSGMGAGAGSSSSSASTAGVGTGTTTGMGTTAAPTPATPSTGSSGMPTPSPSPSSTTSGSSSTEEDVDRQNVCKMNGDLCTYNPDAKALQKSHFLCRKEGDQCNPIKACDKTSTGACEWNSQAKDLADAAGRQCQVEDIDGKKYCNMSKTKEGFVSSSDNITGFEGFSKVF